MNTCLLSLRHYITGVNIGIIYAQNAAPNGPTHWVLKETVDRMMQILEAEPPLKRWDGQIAGGTKVG